MRPNLCMWPGVLGLIEIQRLWPGIILVLLLDLISTAYSSNRGYRLMSNYPPIRTVSVVPVRSIALSSVR